MDEPAVNELIEKSKQGDEIAFRKIVEAYSNMVYSLSLRLLCDCEDAKDAVQDVFIRLWQNLSKFDTGKKFSTWLYKLSINICLDKLKSTKHKNSCISLDDSLLKLVSEDSTDKKMDDAELGKYISQLTAKLTNKQKIVFTLRYFEELEVREITEITNMSSEKIKSNLYLARKTMKKYLGGYLNEEN